MSSGRRRFMTQAGTVVVATATAIVASPHVIAQPKVRWRMPTAFGPALHWHQGVAEHLTKVIGNASGWRFRSTSSRAYGSWSHSTASSQKRSMARQVHASYAKFRALVGLWDHVAEGARPARVEETA